MAVLKSFQHLANQKNAQRSTGPITKEGKAIVSMNAFKHGMKSYNLAPGEDVAAHEASRERWLACFEPIDEVSMLTADWAFRCKTRLFNVAEADEAAMALRVRDARSEVKRQIKDEYIEGQRLMYTDSKKGRTILLAQPAGCRLMLDLVNGLLEPLRYETWQAHHNEVLLRLEGQNHDLPDPMLEGVLECFDAYRTFKANLASIKRADEPQGLRLAAAEIELEQILPGLKLAKDDITQRIDRLREEFEAAYRVAQADAANFEKWSVDVAKVDTSDDGRLRHRYIGEAQRDWTRALADARNATNAAHARAKLAAEATPQAAPTPDQPAEAKPAKPAPKPRVRKASAACPASSPNKPISFCNDSAEPTGAPSLFDAQTAPEGQPPDA